MVVPGTGGAAGSGGAAAGGAGFFLQFCFIEIGLSCTNLLLAGGGAAVVPGTGTGAVVVPGTGTNLYLR